MIDAWLKIQPSTDEPALAAGGPPALRVPRRCTAMDSSSINESTTAQQPFPINEDEKLQTANKSKRKRQNKRKRTRNSKSKEEEDVNKSLVRVNFFADKVEEEEIEVVQTEGYKRNLRQDQRLNEGYSNCHGGSFWRGHHCRENMYSSSPDSEENEYCYDSCDDDFQNYYTKGHSRFSCHRDHKCYHKMKHMKMHKQAAQEHSRMSESVDGFVGHESLDYILDFIGEKSKPEMSKKEKKAKKSQPEKKAEKVKKAKNAGKKEPAADKEQPKADSETGELPTPKHSKKKNAKNGMMKNEGDKENESPPEKNSAEDKHDENESKSYTSRVFINSKFHSKDAQKKSSVC